MLNVVTFKWQPYAGYRSTFPAESVDTLARMVARHYRGEHQVWCFTDDRKGIDRDLVRVEQLWDDLADIPNPTGPKRNPSCYRRLKIFAPEMRERIGERILVLDLDCVITGDVTALWDRDEPFIAWGDTRKDNHYNGSMVLLRAGALPQVWEDFDPTRSPEQAKRAGYFGSDQGWLSYKLGSQYPRWSKRDGVYSFRNHISGGNEFTAERAPLPTDARIVMFHGHVDPWDREAQRLPWVQQHYR